MANLKVLQSEQGSELAGRLRNVFELTEDQLDKVNSWIRERLPQVLDFDPVEIQEDSSKVSIPFSAFLRAVSVATTVLIVALGSSAGLEGVVSDLKDLGFSPEELAKTRRLFKDLVLTKTDAGPVFKKQRMSQLGIPTFQDIDVYFDLRAVFESVPMPASDPEHKTKVGHLFGFTPMAIVTIEIADQAGKHSAFVFQVTKSEYQGLIKVFEEGLVQLNAIKNQFAKMLI